MNWMDTWLFPFGSVFLGGAGLLVLWRGLFGRRFLVRKTRACRRCRYDMTQTEGPKCPECGYAASHEGEHYAGRRRWLVAGCGLVLLFGAVGTSVTPTARGSGWRTVLPMGVQVKLWDGSDEGLHASVVDAIQAGRLSEASRLALAERVVEVACDGDAPLVHVERAVEILKQPGVSVLDEADRLAVIKNGRAITVEAAIRESVRLGVPSTDEMKSWRRTTSYGDDWARRDVVLVWMALSSSGPADDSVVRAAVMSHRWSYSRELADAINRGDAQAMAFIERLLEDPETAVQRRGISFLSLVRWRTASPSDRLVEALSELTRHAEAEVRLEAFMACKDISGHFDSVLAEFVQVERDSAVLISALRSIRTEAARSPELRQALEACASDTELSLPVRLQAAMRVRNAALGQSARGANPEAVLEPLYEQLWAAVIDGSPWAEALAYEQFRHRSRSMGIALARQIPIETPPQVSSRQSLYAWIQAHPAVSSILESWGGYRGQPTHALQNALRGSPRDSSGDPEREAEVTEYMQLWFSESELGD